MSRLWRRAWRNPWLRDVSERALSTFGEVFVGVFGLTGLDALVTGDWHQALSIGRLAGTAALAAVASIVKGALAARVNRDTVSPASLAPPPAPDPPPGTDPGWDAPASGDASTPPVPRTSDPEIVAGFGPVLPSMAVRVDVPRKRAPAKRAARRARKTTTRRAPAKR